MFHMNINKYFFFSTVKNNSFQSFHLQYCSVIFLNKKINKRFPLLPNTYVSLGVCGHVPIVTKVAPMKVDFAILCLILL